MAAFAPAGAAGSNPQLRFKRKAPRRGVAKLRLWRTTLYAEIVGAPDAKRKALYGRLADKKSRGV